MSIETGVLRQFRFKRQSAKGTISGSTAGQVLRRDEAKFALKKNVFDTSAEQNAAQQINSVRHGAKIVEGMLKGLLSPGTYSDWLSQVLRRDYAAVSDITGLSLTIAGSGPYTITRASGSFVSGGITVGMVVRVSAGSVAAANLNNNFFVTGVTATVLTGVPVNGSTLTAEGPIASCTVSVPGKVTFVPTTGHTNLYNTVEEWNPSVPLSLRSQDVKITSASLKLPGDGNAEISFTATGLDQTDSASVYFASPTAETTTAALSSSTGVLYVNGAAVGTVTDLSIDIDGSPTPADGVVGARTRPDIFRGNVKVKGSFTAYFDSSTYTDLFDDETAASLGYVIADSTLKNADFFATYLGSMKLTDSDSDDVDTGLKRTYQFTAQRVGTVTGSQDTTVQTQDSQAG